MDLKEALTVLLKEESIGDFIYDVRERAGAMNDGHKDSLWDHPRVMRYSDACQTLKAELAKLETQTS